MGRIETKERRRGTTRVGVQVQSIWEWMAKPDEEVFPTAAVQVAPTVSATRREESLDSPSERYAT